MAQDLPLRQLARQHGVHSSYVEQALAGKGSFTKQVLIDLRRSSAVGIDAAVPGEQPMVEREILWRRQWRRDPWLQDPVTTHHSSLATVELRLIVRVRCDTDQFTQATRRQLRVTVKRDKVLGAGRDARFVTQIEERAAGSLRQCRNQQLQFAALAFPTDPALLGFAEQALALQQNETRDSLAIVFRPGIALIEFADCLSRTVKQSKVRSGMRCVGIQPVGQQRKLRLAFRIGKVVQMQAMHQLRCCCRRRQHGWNHHHHPVLWRYTLGQGQTRQVLRSC